MFERKKNVPKNDFRGSNSDYYDKANVIKISYLPEKMV